MWDYSDQVKEHFFNPRNAGVLETANAVGEAGAISCGDALRLMIHIDPLTETITDAKFQTFGCGSAIASSSALTELIIGKTVDEVLRITNQDIVDFLGGLPLEKMHCSVMGYEALQAAISNFRGEQWVNDHDESALVCKCFGVDETIIERAVRINRLTTIEQISHYTKAGGGCSTCLESVEEVLVRINAAMAAEGLITAEQAYVVGATDIRALNNEARASTQSEPVVASGKTPRISPLRTARFPAKPGAASHRLTPLQRIRLIEDAVEGVRSHLKADGGDCELVDVDGDQVYVRLSGRCADCQIASATINSMRQKLHEATGLALCVIPVSRGSHP
ncbi:MULTISPECIES: Fe-S cluster assembly protein NifU [Microvirga]|uniref:Fe-S cluster assembly protein NifU n=1 Tax=Microvirga TaxID=186650 RepID=UPI001B377638|nr:MULTISPECIES: Fe-S cluster assembly protein NifU [unclassified Microvirga]MBQ0820415.1 Fe-S cluster assembly protein NifU [Microvirga sp. HBU67558]